MEDIKKRLDQISPSMCLAKWTQVNLYLHSGLTHSCHHPVVHKIPQDDLKNNPSILHNTPLKREKRQEMLRGVRPAECDYCWNMEDLGQTSDRFKKSKATWSEPYFDKVVKSGEGKDFLPTYLEVAFESACNFKCVYCSPTHSSSWFQEIKKNGPYPTANQHHEIELHSIENTSDNHYTKAFWQWWPELKNSLHTFRITGGEPLLSRHTWRFLDELIKNPQPNLEISINSNLGVSQQTVEMLIQKLNELQDKVKSIALFTSQETVGERAEYIRYGLNYPDFLKNAEMVLSQVTTPLRFGYMVTANALSISHMKDFMREVAGQKRKYANHEIVAETFYLRYPSFLSVLILPQTFRTFISETLNYMQNESFQDFEIDGVKNLLAWMDQPEISKERLTRDRVDFYKFFKEYDLRRNTDFMKTFPEYREFLKMCEKE